MGLLAYALLVPIALVGALLARAATKPNTFRLERSTRIQAPPEKVFALLDYFHRWAEWSRSSFRRRPGWPQGTSARVQ